MEEFLHQFKVFFIPLCIRCFFYIQICPSSHWVGTQLFVICQEELSKACRPNLGGVDPEMDVWEAQLFMVPKGLRVAQVGTVERFDIIP